jgi:hypothetical protein
MTSQQRLPMRAADCGVHLAGKRVTVGTYKPSCLSHAAIRHAQDLSQIGDCIWRASD